MFGACKVASKNVDIITKTNGDQVSASIIRQWHIPAIVGSDNKQSMSRRCCHDAIRQQRQAVRPWSIYALIHAMIFRSQTSQLFSLPVTKLRVKNDDVINSLPDDGCRAD